MQNRNYNFIYNSLVEDESDMVGCVAYSLYKKDKIQFIEKFKKDNGGTAPSESDLCHFHEHAFLDSNISRYRMQATSILQEFMNQTLENVANQVEQDVKDNFQTKIHEAVSDLKPKGFWYGVWQSVLGALVFMLIMCALLFMANLSDTEYSFTFGGSGSAKIDVVEQYDSISTQQVSP